MKQKSMLLMIAFMLPGSMVFCSDIQKVAEKTLRKLVMEQASQALQQLPVTVTANRCPRSAGGKHDFYSEGDYWWPDSTNNEAPYIQRDGLSNPNNFVSHREAMIRFSRIVGVLAAAYKLTGESKYVKQAQLHIYAWFIDTATAMSPHLLYAQAIKGRFTGRGIGIIDAIQLMEVAQGILVMKSSPAFDNNILHGARTWFTKYLNWLTTHQYGKDEMNARNNHGTCWVMQAACFARLTGDTALLQFCRNRYKQVLLPNQMAADGSFPLELARTKPYGYALFNLDAMTMICHILSTPDDDLWHFSLLDGRNIRKGIDFLYPHLTAKNKWPYPQDTMYWNDWPVAQPFLLFGANAFHQQTWLNTWIKLEHNPQVAEVIRNLPVRNPLIWLN